MNIKRKFYASAILSIFSAHYALTSDTSAGKAPQPFRPAAIMIGGIKSATDALRQEIDQLQNEAVGVPTLKEDLVLQQQKLASLKAKLGISPIEEQIEALQDQFDQYAQQFFKSAQSDNSYLYYSLNAKVTDLVSDPRIVQRIRQILQIKQEIAQIMIAALNEIKSLGNQINGLTREDQKEMSALRIQKINLEKQRDAILNSASAQEQIEPITRKINDLQSQINQLLALRFTEDRINLIESYKNRMRQYQLMLDFLRNPASIPLTTEEKVIAIE
jgi:hypothetical protein